ncbi:sulfatase family protein [Paenibacillus koleovorans]|uniref:sulfatase family protein n=1 Tax=Paenibacillus koleovorans TaxID=121608 RepID=UPI0013E3B716|nr:sulfatase-like hydrolase/transferase [Paenibacillus koleovorans]
MAEKRSNLLFVMVDQWHAGCLGAAGGFVSTPHLDRLAGEGIRFTKAYCNAPVCGPSRVSFMTGQYPRTHRIQGNNIFAMDDRNDDILPVVFRKHGYETAIIGKAHLIDRWNRAGFEYIRYSDFCDADRSDPLSSHYFRHLVDKGLGDLYDQGALPSGHPGASFRGFVSDIPEAYSLETWTGDEAVRFLDNRDRSRPFMLHLSFQRPHEPLTVPIDGGLLYDPFGIPLPDNAEDLFAYRFAGKPAKAVSHIATPQGCPYVPESEADLRRQLAFYYSLITRIDAQIGRVMESLRRTGEDDNTIIVFVADHGDFAGEHGLILKNLGIYESIHRIPLLLRYPGCPRDERISGLVESVDLYPTLGRLCGIPVPDSVEGVDMGPMIKGESVGKKSVYCEWFPPGGSDKVLAIRSVEYRLVFDADSGEGELYDMQTDPGEIHNLFGKPEHLAIQAELMQTLLTYISRFQVRSSFLSDEQTAHFSRNDMTTMLHKRRLSWSKLEPLYAERLQGSVTAGAHSKREGG